MGTEPQVSDETEVTEAMKAMAKKAQSAEKAGDAMQFAQAALNLAHAKSVIRNLPRGRSPHG